MCCSRFHLVKLQYGYLHCSDVEAVINTVLNTKSRLWDTRLKFGSVTNQFYLPYGLEWDWLMWTQDEYCQEAVICCCCLTVAPRLLFCLFCLP